MSAAAGLTCVTSLSLGAPACPGWDSNVKVINCVIMDDVTVGDGCHIQNCIICSGAVVQERCSLKDCQVAEVITLQ